MRCTCCNKNLSDYESVLKHPITNEYLDTCNKCLQDIPIVPVEPMNMVDDVGYDEFDDEKFYGEEQNDNSETN